MSRKLTPGNRHVRVHYLHQRAEIASAYENTNVSVADPVLNINRRPGWMEVMLR